MARPETPIGMWGKASTKRDGSKWVAQAYCRDYDGVSRQVRRWGETKGEALRKLQDALQNRHRPNGDEVSSETRLSALADIWLADKRTEGKAYRTISRYEDVVKSIKESIGQLRVREATTGRLDKFLNAVASTSPANAKTASTVLSGMLGLAARHDAIPVNPVKGVRLPKTVNKEPVALSPEKFIEFRSVLEKKALAPSKTNRSSRQVLLDVEDFLIATGVRPNEALAVRWDDVFFEEDTVEVNRTVYRKKAADGGGLHPQEHTKGRDDRKMRLPEFCMAMLRRRKKAATSPWVFESAAGTLMDPDNYRQRRRDLLKGTGFEWVTPKSARKAVAALLNEELDSKAAAEQLGHSDDKVTKKHYIPKVRKTVDNARILEIFGGSKQEVNKKLDDPALPDGV